MSYNALVFAPQIIADRVRLLPRSDQRLGGFPQPAFIFGVLPLVIATGAGANARRSLGVTVLTGMLSSTCLAVVLVPAFFVVLQQLDENRRRSKQLVARPRSEESANDATSAPQSP